MTNEEAVRIMIAHQRALEDDTAIFSDKMQKVIAKHDEAFRMAISALERDMWIPFELIEGTNMLQEPIPKDGQKILISVNIEGHEPVQQDIFYYDTGECYLDSNYEIIEDVPAWRPLPEPYRGSEDGRWKYIWTTRH